jgi:transposase
VVQKRIAVDLALIDHYDQLLRDEELSILTTAKQHSANTLYLLRTVPGIGELLSLVLLYEIHDLQRFPRVQAFVSYRRLVTCAKASAGKRYGTSKSTIGNASLKWAFSECGRAHFTRQSCGTAVSRRRGEETWQGQGVDRPGS